MPQLLAPPSHPPVAKRETAEGSMYRTLLGILAIFAGSLVLVNWTFSASREAPAEFRFINGTEPKTLDPQLMTGEPGFRVADAIFEGLTRRDPKTLRPIPGMAKSWDVSPDGRRYTFHLRQDAVWTDGRPVTAHDFAYAWRRAEDPRIASEYAYILYPIAMAEAFNAYGAQAEALGSEVMEAIEALRSESPGGIEPERWQRFVLEQRLSERVKGTPDPLLIRLLGWGREASDDRNHRLTATGLVEAQDALWAEAKRRAELHAEAVERFGIDAGVWAVDDHTLIVELTAPTPYFIDLTFFPSAYPVPRWVVEAPGNEQDWFLPGKIVSNGPYRLAWWRVNDRMRLLANESYWDPESVGLKSIDVLPTENATTSLNLYLTGEVDWLPKNFPSDLAAQLSERDDFYVGPSLIIYYYRINTEVEPFDDPRVRRALNLAIDRQLIVDQVLGLGQLPATHMVPPGMAGYRAPESGIRHDPEEARRLLAEAGFPNGEGIPDTGILYNTQDVHKKIAEVIADQLRRELGLEVRAYNQEWQSYLATIRSRNYTLARAGWIGDYEDPNTFLDIWISEGGNNQTGWGDPTYDRLISAAADIEDFLREPRLELDSLAEAESIRAAIAATRAERRPEARRALGAQLRMQLLAEAERILVAEAYPVIPIYFYVVTGLINPNVEGFYNELELPDGSRGANLRDIHPLNAIRMKPARSSEGGAS